MSATKTEQMDLTATCSECGQVVGVTEEYAADFRERLAEGRKIAVEEGDDPQTLTDEEEAGRIIRSALSRGGWAITDENGENMPPICPKCADHVKAERAARGCPPWCVTDHAAEPWGVCGEFMFLHQAPINTEIITFGKYSNSTPFMELNPQQAEWFFDVEADWAEAAADLRKIAADALAAAEWMETER